MREPTEQDPRYCPHVAWNAERLDLRFPAHGGGECRALGRGVEVHACRRRAGHGEDLIAHVCYCGQSWTDEPGAEVASAGGDEKTAGPAAPTSESSPEGSPLGEVAMVGEQVWREVYRRFYVAQQSKRAISLDLGLDRKTVRRLLHLEAWQPYDRAPQAVTLLTPYASS